MIHEVDEALRLLLVESGLQEGGVELVFDSPTREWAARRNAPTVSVFLYGIREEVARRQTGAAEEHDADGVVVAWRTAPRWFELAYLVTAWTNRPQDEHRLLSEVLRCVTASDALPARLLTGTLAQLGLTVGIDTAGQSQGMPSVSDVWSALGGELKPSIDLRVFAPLSGERGPAGPPVTEGLVVRATDTTGATGGPDDAHTSGAEPGRRLRYHGATDPGPDGFTAPRERPLPPGRRRRGGPAR
ncbi:DUF4255 domain-containing protein [Streptantibioticus ferralitis]|uniref:DUF4255 domain-containing protein n=1 Tax=Streptantibioticus ferralitis TaxID=236510 RepID=A0ABT5Z1E5_9ACTN|nr:DUF4255 domain-containing protein [Streptantibioticus ferralitis]MDF2257593.1 DUF4255 domain-containing protein [Streptantibioticus ferralitis]